MSDGFPSNGAAGAADHKTGQGWKFEHFEGRAIFDGVAKLATPAGVTEGSEVRAIGGSGGRHRVGVSFFVVVVGEMVERLDGRISIGVVRNSQF